MQFSQAVGIDVSKNYLDFGQYKDDSCTYIDRVDNTIEAIKVFLNAKIEDFPLQSTLLCLETTGIYTQPFLVAALELGAQVWLENALMVSQSMGLRRSKNDVLDAQDIAQYAYRHQEKAKIYVPPAELFEQMQSLLRLRSSLLGSLKRLQTPIKEAKRFVSLKITQLTADCFKNTIEGIQSDLKLIEKELMDLLAQDESLKKNFELTQSVVGVGQWTAFAILLTTGGFTKFEDPKQYACYCGVVPFNKSSGKKKGKNRVSFFANKSMKSLFHMCSLTAIKLDPELKAYYERKVQEGKAKMSVLNAVRNKIILRVFAVIKAQKKYEKKVLQNLESS